MFVLHDDMSWYVWVPSATQLRCCFLKSNKVFRSSGVLCFSFAVQTETPYLFKYSNHQDLNDTYIIYHNIIHISYIVANKNHNVISTSISVLISIVAWKWPSASTSIDVRCPWIRSSPPISFKNRALEIFASSSTPSSADIVLRATAAVADSCPISCHRNAMQRAKILKLQLQELALYGPNLNHVWIVTQKLTKCQQLRSQVYRMAKSGNNGEAVSDLFDCKKLEAKALPSSEDWTEHCISVASWSIHLFTDPFQHILTYSNMF